MPFLESELGEMSELKRDYATDRRGLNIDGTVDRDSGPPPSMITLHQIWD